MQGSKIFYKCKDAKDGVAHNYTGDVDSGQMEGSKVRRTGDNWLQSVTHPSLAKVTNSSCFVPDIHCISCLDCGSGVRM